MTKKGTKKREKMSGMRKGAVCILGSLLLMPFTACGMEDSVDMSQPDRGIVGVNIADGSAAGGNAANGNATGNNIANGSIAGGNSTEKVENSNGAKQSGQGEQGSSVGEYGEQQDLAESKYKSILLGDGEFICEDLGNRSLNIKNIGQVITDDDSIIVNAVKFAAIDLDGDGEKEIVLWLKVNGGSDVGFEVLYSRDGTVYGCTQYYRAFTNLKTDGTFFFSGGAADSGMGRLTFSDAGCSVDEQIYSRSSFDAGNELVIQYFANGAPCSADEFHQAMDEQDQKADVEWYDLSADNVNAVL